MDDESGESMEPMEEVLLKELGESEFERLVRGWGGSVAEWLAFWTQAQKGPGSNRSRDAVGNSLMGLLQLRYEHDSSTIRLRFDYDSATTRYEMRTIRLRFERDTTSYAELCAFEQ